MGASPLREQARDGGLDNTEYLTVLGFTPILHFLDTRLFDMLLLLLLPFKQLQPAFVYHFE